MRRYDDITFLMSKKFTVYLILAQWANKRLNEGGLHCSRLHYRSVAQCRHCLRRVPRSYGQANRRHLCFCSVTSSLLAVTRESRHCSGVLGGQVIQLFMEIL